jgi:hypothetical protein
VRSKGMRLPDSPKRDPCPMLNPHRTGNSKRRPGARVAVNHVREDAYRTRKQDDRERFAIVAVA